MCALQAPRLAPCTHCKRRNSLPCAHCKRRDSHHARIASAAPHCHEGDRCGWGPGLCSTPHIYFLRRGQKQARLLRAATHRHEGGQGVGPRAPGLAVRVVGGALHRREHGGALRTSAAQRAQKRSWVPAHKRCKRVSYVRCGTGASTPGDRGGGEKARWRRERQKGADLRASTSLRSAFYAFHWHTHMNVVQGAAGAQAGNGKGAQWGWACGTRTAC